VFLAVGVAEFIVLWEACRPSLGLLEKKVPTFRPESSEL
jgi:hypothetical protein